MMRTRLTQLLVGGVAAVAVVLGAASVAGAAPAVRPAQYAPTTTTVNDGSAPAFSEFAAEQKEKMENSSRMVMMAGLLFILASVAPFTVMKLIPFAEGIDSLEGGARFVSSRPMATVGAFSSTKNAGMWGNGKWTGGGQAGAASGSPGGGPTGKGGSSPSSSPSQPSRGSSKSNVAAGDTRGVTGLGGPVGGGDSAGDSGSSGGGLGAGSTGSAGELDSGGSGGGVGGMGPKSETGMRRLAKYGAALAVGGPVGVAGLYAARRVKEKRSFQPRRGAPTAPGGAP